MRSEAPTAAVLVIGDEVLSGRTQDSNSHTLARFLTALGIDLMEVRVVGDRTDQIVEALDALRQAYDHVFTTGGIGPTHDDITADAVAMAFGVALEEQAEALSILERRYGDTLNAARRRMARIPRGGRLIANPVTDAPGFQIGNVFVLAGVPKIMTAMLDDVVPRLKTGSVVHSRTLRLEGLGEGDIAEPLAQLARANPGLSMGSYPFGSGQPGLMGTHLVIRGRDLAEVEQAQAELSDVLSEMGLSSRAV